MIVGRKQESALLRGLLDDVDDHGAALVLTGMAGIGKSTLLDELRSAATDRIMRTLSISGIQAEVDLPFAGLHRLIRELLPGVRDLPAPQRDAIEVAFGLREGAVSEPFLTALGILGLLGGAAARTPLLITVDDAHWLDRPTTDALTFIGRRLAADPIVLVAALRDGYDSPLCQASLPGLLLGPLTDEASEQLIQQERPGLPAPMRRRVLDQAAGNPLALCELAAAQSANDQPLTRSLERAFAARAAELPGPTRTLVLVAAIAEDVPLGTIFTAAERIDGVPRTMDDLVPAVNARLLEVEGRGVRFRHPLVRSALSQAADVAERHAVHVALASLFDDDPDRRVWHRWAAALGPDPAIAAELEQAGGRALQRGAIATAAVAYERAAEMETGTRRRGQLLLEAAAAANAIGDGDTLIRLLRDARALDLGLREQAHLMWLEDSFLSGPIGNPSRVSDLVAMASRMTAAGDRDLALNLLVTAATRCQWGNLLAEGAAVVQAADRIAADGDDPRTIYIRMFGAPLARYRDVLRDLDRTPPPDNPAELYQRAVVVCLGGRFDEAVPLLVIVADEMRRQGRLPALAEVLGLLAWAALEIGDFGVAMPAAEEALQLAAETQKPFWQTGALIARSVVAAMRGEEEMVETLTAQADRVALPAGVAYLLSLTQYARGVLELGRGRHAEAYEHLRRIREPGDPAYHRLCARHNIGDFTEAAVRSGHRGEAVAEVRKYEESGFDARLSWFDIQLLMAQVHLAEDEAIFDEALSWDLSAWPMARARIELARGEWLRRNRRPVESRAPLRISRDAFDTIGATPWADRARRELRAAGEGSRDRLPDSLDALTPQEFQIVQMVADGLTNGDIAERLYLSRRTVESHLYRVFPKLGVSSRNQLAEAVQSRART